MICKEAIPFLKRFRRAILAVNEDAEAAGSFLARAVCHSIADPATPPMQKVQVPAEIA